MAHFDYETNLFDFILPGQADIPTIHCNIGNDILIDDMYRAITFKIGLCENFNVNVTYFPQTNNYFSKLMHLNIHSLHKNHDAFQNFLQSLNPLSTYFVQPKLVSETNLYSTSHCRAAALFTLILKRLLVE